MSARDEAGTALLEVLVATVVLVIVAGALLTMLATSIAGSAVHRDTAELNVLLEDYAQTATYEIELAPANLTSSPPTPLFLECSGSSPTQVLAYYQANVTFTYPTGFADGYKVGITAVAPFNTSKGIFDGTGCAPGSPGPDASGLQELTAVATAPNGQSASLTFVVRDPAFLQSDATLSF